MEGTLIELDFRPAQPTDIQPMDKNRIQSRILLLAWLAASAPAWADGAVAAPANAHAAVNGGHWSFQPIVDPPVPQVGLADWPRSEIDTFVLARIEAAGLTPSPPADRRTLIRRLYFDLIGLPPTFEEVEQYVDDPAPDATEQVIDRLLQSPHYGERWGRHWLDVARYADTRDVVLVFGTDSIRPYAYTYRDYVVRALNEDTPYDRFIHEQLAADKIRPEVEPWRLAAMGFLTLGRTFCNNVHEIYDDQIDTVSRGLLGLTVACARCHDHKYDDIPTDDYYSLYGVFANSEAPALLPLLDHADTNPGYAEYEEQVAPLREKLREHVDTQYQEITEVARAQIADYLLKIATEPPDLAETVDFFLSLSPDDLRPQILAKWRLYLHRHALPDDPVFGLWHDLMELPDENFATLSGEVVVRWQQRPQGTQSGELNPLIGAKLGAVRFSTRADMARWYGELLSQVAQQLDQPAPDDEVERAARQQMIDIVAGPDSPNHIPRRYTFLYMSRVPRGDYHKQLAAIDKLAVTSANVPPRAMVLHDAAEIQDPRIFVRGNPRTTGPRVPLRFLRVLAGDQREPFANGSGRLDLAHEIADPSNPLTSRVLVNRVWMQHFGQPLVHTPDDFGTRSDPPSHPLLLDHLAARFMQERWSLKQLHRRILLSAAYQQSSFDRPDCRQVDPENQLYWRANRRRLELEPMRDSLLAISGRLDRTIGGRPVDVAGDPHNRRRTIYGLIDRQDLPGLFRAFDFAAPDQTVARRSETATPQQSLFSMNSDFMVEQAKGLADRVESSGVSTTDQVRELYRLVFSRNPSDVEVESAARFVQQTADEQTTDQRSSLAPWVQLAQVLLLTNEWMFVD